MEAPAQEKVKPVKTEDDSDKTKRTEDDSESSSTDDEGAKEQEKVLKSLAFPEIESGSFSPDLCPKVTKCISKRLTKLELHAKAFADAESLTEIQKKWGSRFAMTLEVFANLNIRISYLGRCFRFALLMACLRPQRLQTKVADLMGALAKVQDQIQNSYTQGLVNGFDKPSIPQWLGYPTRVYFHHQKNTKILKKTQVDEGSEDNVCRSQS